MARTAALLADVRQVELFSSLRIQPHLQLTDGVGTISVSSERSFIVDAIGNLSWPAGCILNGGGIYAEELMNRSFSEVATYIAHQAGRPSTFLLAVLVILLWAATGPIFNYSDTWQLLINTGTTIVTFLMVFVIQNSQNRDGAAIQAKLDELIRSSQAQNQFIGIENLTDEEIEEYRQSCSALAKKVTERAASRKTDNVVHLPQK